MAMTRRRHQSDADGNAGLATGGAVQVQDLGLRSRATKSEKMSVEFDDPSVAHLGTLWACRETDNDAGGTVRWAVCRETDRRGVHENRMGFFS